MGDASYRVGLGNEISSETANAGALPLFLRGHSVLRQFDLASKRKNDAFL